MKYLILGVDPGTTTGVAAIDLDGNTVAVKSERHMGLDGVIEYATSLGRLALVASDVNPPPSFILKLSASLGSPIYFPQKSLKVGEKTELTRGHVLNDAHQRDALAAALSALAHYENKMRKIDARKLGVEAKKRVLAGEKITPTKKTEREQKTTKKPKAASAASVEGLRRKINKLREEAEAKDNKIIELEKSITESESKIKAAYDRRAAERSQRLSIKTLKSKIQELEGELSEYRKLARAIEKVGVGELKLVGAYPKIFDGLTLLNKKITGEDLDALSKAKYVFTSIKSNKTVLNKLNATVLDPSILTRIRGNYFAAVKDLTKAAEEKEKPISLEDLVSDYRRRSLN